MVWVAMFTITRRVTFEAAHRLETWEGHKCQRMHGHSWVLEATWTGKYQAQNSAVVDFGLLGSLLNTEIVFQWDHQYLNEVEAKKDVTCEYLASIAFRRLTQETMNTVLIQHLRLVKVRVQETENCWVEYTNER